MPTYEYRCGACGYEFEKFQPITAAPMRKCPKCGKNRVKRLISTGAGLIFKGSGFYITDYRDSSYKEKAKSESGGESKSGGDASKTESKPAAENKPATEAKPKIETKPSKGAKPSSR